MTPPAIDLDAASLPALEKLGDLNVVVGNTRAEARRLAGGAALNRVGRLFKYAEQQP